MRSLTAITEYFISHPILGGLRYAAAALAGSFVFALIALFSGQFDVTVPINGLFMLSIIVVATFLRFGLYRVVQAMLGFRNWAIALVGVAELAYFGWMLFVAWDIAHPEYSDGAFTMMAMLGHVLLVPIAALALLIVGIVWAVRAILARVHCARVAREWRQVNADPTSI